MKIGFIGLGTLRTAMAQRVMSLGHEVVGFNRSPTKAAALADAGLQQATTVEAVCDADIVFSSMTPRCRKCWLTGSRFATTRQPSMSW
jgi:2-hydroxy-3-oxopropionate reductase